MKKNETNETNTTKKEIDIPSFVNSNYWRSMPHRRNTVYDDEDNGAFLEELNSSLAKQVTSELKESNHNDKNIPNKKRKSSKMRNTFIAIILTITALCSFLVFTDPGHRVIIKILGKYIYSNIDYQLSNKSNSDGSSETISRNKNEDKSLSNTINILLIGVEEFENAKNTDSMMIATINTKDNSLKITSLMRDLYVQIPGHDNNRLNSVYAKGGIELLYDTIDVNFGIKPDGYCLVNFSAFQQIIDLIGGVKITLTEDEANYLQRKNYISDPANRNVVAGTQIMNGNQALGYCRIRKVATATEHDDFGRTQRHRIVLGAIYDKVKSKNIFQLAIIMNDILSQIPIVTDVSPEDFNTYLEKAISLKVNEIENYRIPTDGSYENIKVQMGSRKQEVLQPVDWDATRKEIQTFIYGELSAPETAK